MNDPARINEPKLNKVLFVQIVTMLISVVAMFIDSIIISIFLKTDALAAYGFTTPVILLITAFGGVIGNGVQVLAGESAGAGDSAGLNRILSTALLSGTAGALILLAAILISPESSASFLGARSANVTSLTADYLRGLVFSFPAIAMLLTVPVFMQMDGGRKQMLKGSVLLIALNIAFDIINVLVVHGGMFGMAMATTLSYWLSIAYLYFAFFRKSRYRVSPKLFSAAIMKSMLRLGMLYLTYKLCQVIMSYFINRMLAAYGGEVYVAAASIIASINLVTGAVPSGFGSTTTMIGSYYFGEGSREKFMSFLKEISSLSVKINCIIAALTVASAPLIVKLFAPDSTEVFDAAVLGLRLYSFSIIFNTLNYIKKNSCQCVKESGKAYAVCIMNDLAFPLAAALIISVFMPIQWIWAGYTAGQLLTWVLVSYMIGNYNGEYRIWKQ